MYREDLQNLKEMHLNLVLQKLCLKKVDYFILHFIQVCHLHQKRKVQVVLLPHDDLPHRVQRVEDT